MWGLLSTGSWTEGRASDSPSASWLVSLRTSATTWSPGWVCKGRGDSGGVDEGVTDVDEELEGEGEAVAEQAGGDEDSVDVVEGDVAVADGLVAEGGGVSGGDHGRAG